MSVLVGMTGCSAYSAPGGSAHKPAYAITSQESVILPVHSRPDNPNRKQQTADAMPGHPADAAVSTSAGDQPSAQPTTSDSAGNAQTQGAKPNAADDTVLAQQARLAAHDESLRIAIDDALKELLNNQPRQAIEGLTLAQAHIADWPLCPHAPALLFWLAHSYDQINESTAAMVTFRKLITEYPQSRFSNRSRQRLTELETQADKQKKASAVAASSG